MVRFYYSILFVGRPMAVQFLCWVVPIFNHLLNVVGDYAILYTTCNMLYKQPIHMRAGLSELNVIGNAFIITKWQYFLCRNVLTCSSSILNVTIVKIVYIFLNPVFPKGVLKVMLETPLRFRIFR